MQIQINEMTHLETIKKRDFSQRTQPNSYRILQFSSYQIRTISLSTSLNLLHLIH